MSLTALVLSAGRSRRMGIPKARMLLDGTPLLSHILAQAAQVADQLLVVVGSDTDPALTTRAEAVLALAPWSGRLRTAVIVGCPTGQPIDSIRAGLTAIEQGNHLLLWPVDHPFADAPLLKALLRTHANMPDCIVEPRYRGKGGHPVLVGKSIVAELSTHVADMGAREVIRRIPKRIVAIDCLDPRLVAELNTPAQAAALGITAPQQHG